MNDPITVRLLDIYRIGLGPSSSHTVGPMRAARQFRLACFDAGFQPARLRVLLKGSLSATGRGHGTDRAILAGLCGWEPETCDVDDVQGIVERLAADPRVAWGDASVEVRPEDVRFLPYLAYKHETLPHPNTMVCQALDAKEDSVFEQTWCSVGGGFVRQAGEEGSDFQRPPPSAPRYPFATATDLVRHAETEGCTLGEIVLRNEESWDGTRDSVLAGLDSVWNAMRSCIGRGLDRDGVLPGGLGLKRRAGELLARVERGEVEAAYGAIARAQAYAYAVNEENAAGGRVVTAPTNGAAGVLPGVLVEASERLEFTRERIHSALATAAGIAMLIKTHASLSGAEVGCQGEVGSATAMAAAAMCETLGGTVRQAEQAAEIAIEHNLGLTCDPLKGLVQAPCIERNAMGVAKAWSAAQLALHSGEGHLISLDRVIEVMKRTGDDMKREYKETSEGGLAAVSLPEC
ncbi:MAG: L-serine ammonia-lyase [Planctomycetota bacterium]